LTPLESYCSAHCNFSPAFCLIGSCRLRASHIGAADEINPTAVDAAPGVDLVEIGSLGLTDHTIGRSWPTVSTVWHLLPILISRVRISSAPWQNRPRCRCCRIRRGSTFWFVVIPEEVCLVTPLLAASGLDHGQNQTFCVTLSRYLGLRPSSALPKPRETNQPERATRAKNEIAERGRRT
jgi:hypothetical protein